MKRLLAACLSAFVVCLSCTDNANADDASSHSVTGLVVDSQGAPITGVNVAILSLDRGVVTAADGGFVVERLPAATLDLTVSHVGYVNRIIPIDLRQGSIKLSIQLEPTVLALPDVTVTASTAPTEILSSNRCVSVVGRQELAREQSNSLSGALRSVPGVQIADQGPMVAKPVIRGMTNQRIVVLRDGIKHEAQQWSNHHTPEVDLADADRIEVLRGPSSLLYGSGAIGGVVHILSPRLRTLEEGSPRRHRRVTLQGFTNTGQGRAHLALTGADHEHAWRLNLSGRRSQYYAVPGQRHFLVKQLDTGFRQWNARGAFAWSLGAWKLQLGGTHYWEEQELIGEGHWHNSGGPDGGPWYHAAGPIYSPTRHWKTHLSARTQRGPHRLELDGSLQCDHRQGIPSGMPPQVDLKARYGSLHARWHHLFGSPYPGVIGLSLSRKTDRTYGPEVLLPNSDVTDVGVFFLQHVNRLASLSLSAGLRSDWRFMDVATTEMVEAYVDASGQEIPPYVVAAEQKCYGPVLSSSAGLVWRRPGSPFSLAVNAGSGWRAPTPVELYIHGVHHGSYEYMVGDAALDPEVAVNADLILRWVDRRAVAELSFFYNRIYDYIFANPTGAFHYLNDFASIPMYRFEQSDALIKGLELRTQLRCTGWMRLNVGYDLVRGEVLSAMVDADRDGRVEKNLPRISPDRAWAGVELALGDQSVFRSTQLTVEGRHYAAQKRLGEFENVINRDADGDDRDDEIHSPAYAVVDLSLSTDLSALRQGLGVAVAVKNLLNAEYWSHLSNYKGIARNPGFDLSLMLTLDW